MNKFFIDSRRTTGCPISRDCLGRRVVASMNRHKLHTNSIGCLSLSNSGRVDVNSGAISGPNSREVVNGALPHCTCGFGLKTS